MFLSKCDCRVTALNRNDLAQLVECRVNNRKGAGSRFDSQIGSRFDFQIGYRFDSRIASRFDSRIGNELLSLT